MSNFKERIKVKSEVITSELTRDEAILTYKNFIGERQKQFEAFIHYLNRYINGLREKGIISPFLKFYARIKATNSVLENYEKKAVDDIFGIEFICSTEQEIEIVQQVLEPILKVDKIKMHDKENGYKAIHNSCSIREEITGELGEKIGETKSGKFPILETQYKTIQVYWEAVSGRASHEKYKDTKVSETQKLYDNGQMKIGEHIPQMWISNADTDNMRELSMEEILRKMYPSLNLDRKEEKGMEL